VSRATHLAAFAGGAILATAVGALAIPPPAPHPDVARFKTLDAFAQALTTVETTYVDPTDEKKLVYDAVRGMVHNLDPNTTFLPPQRYAHMRQDTEGEFGGIGVTLGPGEIDDARPRVPPYPVIDEVIPHSPADVAGLQVDDQVTSINRQITAEPGKELKEAGQWEAALRGGSGTRVTVEVLRVGWHEPRAFTVVRAQIKLPTVAQHVVDKGIGYLSINHFSEATSNDVNVALAQLAKQQALDVLVLDLRGNPGGLVDQAVLVADQFLESGTIVTIRGRAGAVENQVAHPGGLATKTAVIALVDSGTASAAEILASSLHDANRAKLVGLPTYGKGTVQTFFDLDDGSGLKLTTARYYTPKGNSLESKGIIPDVRAEAFVPTSIVVGPGSGSGSGSSAGSGAGSGSSATINDADGEDPQLASAIKLAREALHAAPIRSK
jgi:carboxyl-terminal processing protease